MIVILERLYQYAVYTKRELVSKIVLSLKLQHQYLLLKVSAKLKQALQFRLKLQQTVAGSTYHQQTQIFKNIQLNFKGFLFLMVFSIFPLRRSSLYMFDCWFFLLLVFLLAIIQIRLSPLFLMSSKSLSSPPLCPSFHFYEHVRNKSNKGPKIVFTYLYYLVSLFFTNIITNRLLQVESE